MCVCQVRLSGPTQGCTRKTQLIVSSSCGPGPKSTPNRQRHRDIERERGGERDGNRQANGQQENAGKGVRARTCQCYFYITRSYLKRGLPLFLAMHVFNFNEINACNASHAPLPRWPFRSCCCCCSSCYLAAAVLAANLLLSSVHLARPLLMYVMHGSSSEPEPEPEPELQLDPKPEPETGAKRVKC